MKLEEMVEQAKADAIINETDLLNETKKIPKLHQKWLLTKVREAMVLKDLVREYETLYKTRWLFYQGKATAEEYKEEPFHLKVLRGDIDVFLKSDTKLQQLRKRIDIQEEKVDFAEKTLRSINNRQWEIRAMIDYQKLLNGIN